MTLEKTIWDIDSVDRTIKYRLADKPCDSHYLATAVFWILNYKRELSEEEGEELLELIIRRIALLVSSGALTSDGRYVRRAYAGPSRECCYQVFSEVCTRDGPRYKDLMTTWGTDFHTR